VRHIFIAPKYLPVQTIGEFLAVFNAIMQSEGIDISALGGQSYGGLLAQAYLADKTKAVERLILLEVARPTTA
jgi:pimeloyl-ACP methyl ester carboxylesterase